MNKTIFNSFLILIFALLLAVSACSKGSGSDDDSGDDDNGDDDFVATSITFTPSEAGAAGDIWLEADTADPAGNAFTLKVVGDGIPAVYGVAGRLQFDTAIAALESAEPGNALEGMGATIIAKGAPNDKGGVFGASRSVDYSNNAALSKDKTVAALHFKVLGAGTTDLVFNADKSHALDSGLDLVEVANWVGGVLTVE